MRKDCLCLVLAAAWGAVKSQMMIPPMMGTGYGSMPYGGLNSPLMMDQMGYGGVMPGYSGQWGSAPYPGRGGLQTPMMGWGMTGSRYPFMGQNGLGRYPFSRIPTLFSGGTSASSESTNPASSGAMPMSSGQPSDSMAGQMGQPGSSMPSSMSGPTPVSGSPFSGAQISPSLSTAGQAGGVGYPGSVPQYSSPGSGSSPMGSNYGQGGSSASNYPMSSGNSGRGFSSAGGQLGMQSNQPQNGNSGMLARNPSGLG